MREKLILTDCDGVLLHWEWSFDLWMAKHGYTRNDKTVYDMDINYDITRTEAYRLVKMFNETVYINNLPLFADAIRYVKLLHEHHGYIFHVITSINSEPSVVEARVKNLHSVFGSSPFYRITCVDDKRETLSEYKNSGCFWIEDHVKNYELGLELGLTSILMTQRYNTKYQADARVKNWAELYRVITND